MEPQLTRLYQAGLRSFEATVTSGRSFVRAGQQCRLRLPDGTQANFTAQTDINSNRVQVLITDQGEGMAWCLSAGQVTDSRLLDYRRERPDGDGDAVEALPVASTKFAFWRSYSDRVDVYVGGAFPVKKVLTVEADFDFSPGSPLSSNNISGAFGVTLDNTGPNEDDWVVSVTYVDTGVNLTIAPGYVSRLLIVTKYGNGATFTYTQADYPTTHPSLAFTNNGYGIPRPYSAFSRHGNNTAFGSARNPQLVRNREDGDRESISLYEGSALASSVGPVVEGSFTPFTSRIVAMGIISDDEVGQNSIFRSQATSLAPFFNMIDLDLTSTLRRQWSGQIKKVNLITGQVEQPTLFPPGSIERVSSGKGFFASSYSVEEITSRSEVGAVLIRSLDGDESIEVPITPVPQELIDDVFIAQRDTDTMGQWFEPRFVQIKTWLRQF